MESEVFNLRDFRGDDYLHRHGNARPGCMPPHELKLNVTATAISSTDDPNQKLLRRALQDQSRLRGKLADQQPVVDELAALAISLKHRIGHHQPITDWLVRRRKGKQRLGQPIKIPYALIAAPAVSSVVHFGKSTELKRLYADLHAIHDLESAIHGMAASGGTLCTNAIDAPPQLLTLRYDAPTNHSGMSCGSDDIAPLQLSQHARLYVYYQQHDRCSSESSSGVDSD